MEGAAAAAAARRPVQKRRRSASSGSQAALLLNSVGPRICRRVVAEAEQRLLGTCRAIVVQAATDAWAAHEAATAAAAGAASSSAAANGLSSQGRPTASEDVAWEAAARGPLLVSILAAYRSVSPDAWRAELARLYPHLAKLVCSGQPGVRSALAHLMRSQLPPLVSSRA